MHWEFKDKQNRKGPCLPVIHIPVRETDNKVSQIREFQAAVSAMRKIKQVMK